MLYKALSRHAAEELQNVPQELRDQRRKFIEDFEAKREAASRDAQDAQYRPFIGRADYFVERLGIEAVPDLLKVLRGMPPNVMARTIELLDLRYRRHVADTERAQSLARQVAAQAA
jgi:hypothetical protein